MTSNDRMDKQIKVWLYKGKNKQLWGEKDLIAACTDRDEISQTMLVKERQAQRNTYKVFAFI